MPAQSSDARIALPEIQQALPVISFDATAIAPKMLQELSAKLAGYFSLGWTHYVALLTIINADERRFYEIEASVGVPESLSDRYRSRSMNGWLSVVTRRESGSSQRRG